MTLAGQKLVLWVSLLQNERAGLNPRVRKWGQFPPRQAGDLEVRCVKLHASSLSYLTEAMGHSRSAGSSGKRGQAGHRVHALKKQV